jgi:ATP-dependent helicase/DNAse subunit B
MERFRSIPGSILLTPTATMAEHIRNEMARAGEPVRPSRVQTLAGFLEEWAAEKPAPPPLVQIAIEDALDAIRPSRFQGVTEFRGFRTALTGLFEEIPAEQAPDELREVFFDARARLQVLGFALRRDRLRSAAEALTTSQHTPPHIVIDGFFSLSSPDVEFVRALGARAATTLVLPGSPGKLAGFDERPFEVRRRHPIETSFRAATIEQEAEEITRRVLAAAERGVRFREIGIVLRSHTPYGPILETTLARFGVPVRSYFTGPLSAHPAVMYLSGVVRALLQGWPLAELNRLSRMPVSGLGATGAGDELDFELRKRLLPGSRGLPSDLFEKHPSIACLGALDDLAGAYELPQDWASKLAALAKLIPDPQIADQFSRAQSDGWASTVRAIAAWKEAMKIAGLSCAAAVRISLKQFWDRAETVLALSPLRNPDRRREAVALLDVFEARQWQLRTVFVPGLVERLFPVYHREDSIVGDEVRARLGLPTAATRQQEERFLFDLATSRATEETVLSCARFNEKGDEQLASFFLMEQPADLPAARIRPAPRRPVEIAPPHPIQDGHLRVRLAEQHKSLSPTSVESFIQCPFLFFGRKTLRRKLRPRKPRDRLDVLVQGSILHSALAQWAKTPLLGSSVLLHEFETEAKLLGIPPGYRTEAVKLELLRHFEAFLRNTEVPLPSRVRTEEKVRFALHGGLTISGRIDRIDIDAQGNALVIDYKYSASERIQDKVEAAEEGDMVQAGLYWLAAEKALGLKPIGMLYCGLRKKVSWNGWHLNYPGLQAVGEARTPEAMRDLIAVAEQRTISSHEEILSGRIEAKPKDDDFCRLCDYRDVCRIETIGAALKARQ